MCRNWITVMDAETRTAWGIPADEFTALGTLYGTAQTVLQKAMDDETRTLVINEQCRVAFDALDEAMRFMKKHHLLVPPLTTADLVALGLGIPGTPHPIPPPTNQVTADLTFPGIHLVELRNIRPVTGLIPDPRSDYGVRIYYGLTGPASSLFRFRLNGMPGSGNDLPYSFFTRRKREFFDFDGESGNTVYFCLRYENSKGRREGVGPFGPILSAVIP
jgi:hypothetical protein